MKSTIWSRRNFLKLAGASAEGVLMPATKLLVAQGLAPADPFPGFRDGVTQWRNGTHTSDNHSSSQRMLSLWR